MLQGKIFISHLHEMTTRERLTDFLEEESYLKVDYCHIYSNRNGTPIGLARVDLSLNYPSGHERSELKHEIYYLNGSKIDGNVVHVKLLHLEENAQHLWDTHHFEEGRTRGYYRDYNHFREDYHNSYRSRY